MLLVNPYAYACVTSTNILLGSVTCMIMICGRLKCDQSQSYRWCASFVFPSLSDGDANKVLSNLSHHHDIFPVKYQLHVNGVNGGNESVVKH